jgi:4-amino-4-deoxy-L-arabinose transferase-like glycosyltransferase
MTVPDASRPPRPWTTGLPKRRTVVLLVFIVASALRLIVVGHQSLWSDELFSLAMATGHSLEHPADTADPARGDFVESPRPEPPSYYSRYLEHESPPAGVSRVIRAVFLSDTSPPLYYILLSAWTLVLGTSDWALRLFSAVASLACLALLMTLARRVGGRSATVPAAALFATLPVVVHYSTEGRMYALMWLWVLAMLVLALQLRIRGGRPVLLAAWVIVGAAGLLTHYFFAPVWLAASVWLLVYPGHCRRRRLAFALALTVALVLPWYSQVPQSLTQWRVTGYWLKLTPDWFGPILGPLRLPWTLLSLRTVAVVPRPVNALYGAVILLVFALACCRLRNRVVTPRRLLLWAACVAAVSTPVILDLVLGTYMSAVPRYAIAALPPGLVLIALTLTALAPRRRAHVTALLVTLAMVGTWRILPTQDRNGEPFAQLGQFLVRHARASDVVIVHSIPSGVCGVARSMITNGALSEPVPLVSWIGQLKQGDERRDIEILASGRGRVFLVEVHTVGDESPRMAWLRRGARLVSTHAFKSAAVDIFERGEYEAHSVR